MATTKRWDATRDLRVRPENMSREKWAAERKRIKAEREAAKDPAAVAMGRKRWIGVAAPERTLHAKRAAKRRAVRRQKQRRERKEMLEGSWQT